MGLRSTVATLLSDFRRMRTEFVGASPPPQARERPAWDARVPRQAVGQATESVERGQRSVEGAGSVSHITRTIGARSMVIEQVVHETKDAVSLVLRDVDGSPFLFSPGQFLTILVEVAGERLRRSYSISSSADVTETATITIKRVPGGKVSAYLVERAHPGMRLEAFGPAGTFTPQPSAAPRRLVLIAGGGGITPMMSIVRTILAREAEARIELLYANRSEPDVIFKAALSSTQCLGASTSRLMVRHVLGAELDHGSVSLELDALACSGASGTADAQYFVCGPELMMREVRKALAQRGVPETAVHEERFTSAPTLHVGDAGAAHPTATEQKTVQLRVLSADQTGAAAVVQIARNATILRAALDAGLELPYSCTEGECGTCRVRAVNPKAVEMDSLNCLSSSDVKAGYILTCVARALGDLDLVLE